MIEHASHGQRQNGHPASQARPAAPQPAGRVAGARAAATSDDAPGLQSHARHWGSCLPQLEQHAALHHESGSVGRQCGHVGSNQLSEFMGADPSNTRARARLMQERWWTSLSAMGRP